MQVLSIEIMPIQVKGHPTVTIVNHTDKHDLVFMGLVIKQFGLPESTTVRWLEIDQMYALGAPEIEMDIMVTASHPRLP